MTDYVQELAEQTIGCRLKIVGTSGFKTLTPEQRKQMADVYDADHDWVRSSKRLMDAKRPELKAMQHLKNLARAYWGSMTLPHVVRGVRLLRRDRIAEFSLQVDLYKDQLTQKCLEADAVYSEILEEAKGRLGGLFCREDYPSNLKNCMTLDYDFPNLSAPDYLLELSPQLYEREQKRIEAEFAQSLQIAEEAFAAELHKMVSNITDKLTGTDDNGKPKIFHDSLVNNVNQFFSRFRDLEIGSTQVLKEIVDKAESAMAGVTASELRNNALLRDKLKSAVAAIQTDLETGLIDKPNRKIKFSNGSDDAPAAE